MKRLSPEQERTEEAWRIAREMVDHATLSHRTFFADVHEDYLDELEAEMEAAFRVDYEDGSLGAIELAEAFDRTEAAIALAEGRR